MSVTPDVAYARMYEICDGSSFRAVYGREKIMKSLRQHFSESLFDQCGAQVFDALLVRLKVVKVSDMATAMNPGPSTESTPAAAMYASIASDVGMALGFTPGTLLQELLAALEQALPALLAQLLACIPAA